MLWVLRPGKNAVYFEDFVKNNRAYICWEGYDKDLSRLSSHNDYTELAAIEPENTNTVAKRNRASQLEYFCKDMKTGDRILLPKGHSRSFALVEVVGPYEYQATEGFFPHSRRIKILVPEISSAIFSQNERYSLGAFRTLFHAKDEELLIQKIEKKYGKLPHTEVTDGQ